jgi:hypothetical protein
VELNEQGFSDLLLSMFCCVLLLPVRERKTDTNGEREIYPRERETQQQQYYEAVVFTCTLAPPPIILLHVSTK